MTCGTLTAYNRGCRCDPCRKSRAKYAKAQRKRARARPRPKPVVVEHRPLAGAGLDLLALTGAPYALVRLLLLDSEDRRPRHPAVRQVLKTAWYVR